MGFSLRSQFQIVTEWNMYFANLGHNLCDGHAGKMKVYVLLAVVCHIRSSSYSFRQVREAEGNYNPMVTASDVIQAIGGKLTNQISILLEAAQINACDEENVKPVGKGFIRNYHHFTYQSAGVVACSYIKGGPYVLHKMKQGAGMLALTRS